MRKYRLLNWLMILLFIGTVLTVFLLRNQGWNYANLLGNNRESVKYSAKISRRVFWNTRNDSIQVDNLLSLLTTNSLNDNFVGYIKTIASEDSTVYQGKVKIRDIDGYTLMSSKKEENKHILSFSSNNDNTKDNKNLKNIANINYQNKDFKVQYQQSQLLPILIIKIVISDIIGFFIILILSLKNNSPFQKYFKLIFFIYFFKIVFFISSLFSDYYQVLCLLDHVLDKIIPILLVLAFYKIFARYHLIIPRLIILVLLLNLWLDSILIPTLIFLICLFLIIFSERGVKRKIYQQNLFFVLLFIGSFIAVFISLISIISYLDCWRFEKINYSTGFLVPMEILDFTRNGIFSIPYIPAFILIILLIMSVVFRIVKIKLSIIEYLYVLILKIGLVILSIFFTIGIWFIEYPPQVLRTFGLGILTILLFILFNKYLKLFPFINPVRFNFKKVVMNLLNDSYNHTNHKEYAEFFFSFLKKLQPKAKISIINKNSFIGDEFPHLQYTRLEEVLELNSQKKAYLNLDLELLDETEIGKEVEDFNNAQLPHLIYPIYDRNNQLQAIVVFGKFPGIYWQKSLTEAIHKLVEVFSGFYLNFLVQEKFMEQGKSIVKEQEERLYNHKLWEVETKKNEELEAERQHIMKSMEYASLIQKSILPQSQEMLVQFPQHFVIWQQRDIVGGDLYWLHPIPDSDEVIFSVIDCTGHGVPGALMSVASNSALEQLVQENSNYNPGRLLSNLHQSVGNTLHQAEMNTQQDGMDMSIIKYNKENKCLSFAGANHNLILIKGKTQELIRVRGDRYSIGGLKWKNEIKFNQHDLELESGDTIYLFSDGVVDQPFQHSESKLSRLGSKVWHDFLVENNQQSMEEVKMSIEKLIDEMIKSSPQRDDICIVGIRVD